MTADRLTAYPKSQDAAPLPARAFIIQKQDGTFPTRVLEAPQNPDHSPLPLETAIFVDENGRFIPMARQADMSAQSLNLFTDLAAATVLANTTRTAAAAVTGDGGGATYVLDAEQTALTARGSTIATADHVNNGTSTLAANALVAAAEARIRRADAAGRWFTLLRTSGVKPLALAGDTATTLIQAALDFSSVWRMDNFKVEPGAYSIVDSLFITRGLSTPGVGGFSQGALQGSRRSFSGSQTLFGGTVLTTTMTTKPAIIVQGARFAEIRDINLVGPLDGFLAAKTFCLPGVTPSSDDTVIGNWNNGYPIGQYNVLVGIAVDPYSSDAGTTPAGPYPQIADPTWAGVTQYYGRALTWGLTIERTNIGGYPCAIAIHPCPSESQGDMTRIRDFDISNCIYGISVGNTQSRNVEIRNGQIRKTFCCITNNQFGPQHGLLGGSIDNVCIYNVTKIFDLQTSTSGPIAFRNVYTEAIWMLGELHNGASVSQNISFDSCDFRFDHITNNRGAPYAVIREPAVKDAGYGSSMVGFHNCNIETDWIFALDVQQVRVTDTRVWVLAITNAGTGYPALTTARAMAHNGTAGVVTALFKSSLDCNIGYNICNIDALTATQQQWTGDEQATLTNRIYCIPRHMKKAKPNQEQSPRASVTMPRRNVVASLVKNAGSLMVWSVTGNTVTFTNASSAATAAQSGMTLGCVVKDSTSGAFFFISAYDPATGITTMTALTGFYYDGAAYVMREAFDATVGTLFFCVTGFYTPSYIMYGDTTAGSAVVANLRNAAGGSGWLANEVVVGDYLWVDPGDPTSPFTAGANSKVTAFNSGAATMTMGGNAAFSQTGRRFELFIRTS